MSSTYWRSVAAGSLLAIFAILACPRPATAQQTLGSINGTVLDSSGASVPDATISVTNTQIALTRTTKSQTNGFYQIFNLPIGAYKVSITHDGFDTTDLSGIAVQEARTTTVNGTLKVGQVSNTVEVTDNPLLNATDTTNGYTLDSAQIAETPLATGSFTQLATLSPGVSAELLSNLDSNAGLGNQPIWANGQRDTSNTFQVNGVDATNLFNGKSSSGAPSQRYNFGVGETSAVGGEFGTGTSVYESNGNSLPSPPPEFIQEVRVNTSMYDAQQGATSGAQIDVNTSSGTNNWHGQVYGSFANNSLNANPFFFNQQYQLATQGLGVVPESLANPALHRWTTGATVGGPILKDKFFFFLAYQHGYNSDEASGISQLYVPPGLVSPTGNPYDTTPNARSLDVLNQALVSWGGPKTEPLSSINSIASAIMNAQLPNGQYMVPWAQTPANTPYTPGFPNVDLIGTSLFATDQANAALDYDVTHTDRLSFKAYYQNDPVHKPYGLSNTGGFPLSQQNGSDVGVIDNTISIGSRMNWEQRLGYVRMRSYSYDQQKVAGGTFGIGGEDTSGFITSKQMPGLEIKEFANEAAGKAGPNVSVGPFGSESATINAGFYQNRLNPSTNVIFSLGKHTIVAGAGYSYTQLNIENNRDGELNVTAKTFQTFLEGESYSSNVIDSTVAGSNRNNADRYYRTNEIDGYVQDKWQAWPNLSITAGVRYDYHGGMTEKYGNLFNFDPSLYNVTGTTTTGFTVTNAGFVIAPNNSYRSQIPKSNLAGGDSTLDGRQWGISPRVGFAWAPKQNAGKVVFSGGAGLYYDRGELFSYLSQPYGVSDGGGVFGVTQSLPLVSLITGTGTTLANPIGSASYTPPNANPASINGTLQGILNGLTGTSPIGNGSVTAYNCGAVNQQEGTYYLCPNTIEFGAYDHKNVLPYTLNYTLKMQWQPRNDVAFEIGYVGNRGRHSVIPVPFNEPGIATPSNPIWGETASYGWQTLNANSTTTVPEGGYNDYDYNSIAGEPWDTESGGNVDFRTPYVGYNFNSALFKTAGVSAYDALQTHLEKRLSHDFSVGASYTWSHALDEQSDIGIFFTGDNPNRLRDSWGSADFDRTNVFSANFLAKVPDVAKPHSLLGYGVNGWNLTGVVTLQSGQPYSLYEFYGASGSLYVGNYPNLLNPVLAVKDPSHPNRVFTGNKGSFRGAGGSYIPALDPTQIAINYLTPGQKGIPVSTGSDPQDIYETDFPASDQRNIFRQAFQKRADISFRKSFKFTGRFSAEYAFNVFNITNTTSLDIPNNQTEIAQANACSPMAYNNDYCYTPYLGYGQVVTTNNPGDQHSARSNLYELPVTYGTGKSLIVPTSISNTSGSGANNSCTSSTCPNNGANFGSVTGVIGGARAITMGLHITF